MSLDEAAKRAWRTWGHAWAMFAVCSRCGQFAYCRGTRRDRLVCLECFDLGPGSAKGRSTTGPTPRQKGGT